MPKAPQKVSPDKKVGFINNIFNLTFASLIKLIPRITVRDKYHDTKVPELTLCVTSKLINISIYS